MIESSAKECVRVLEGELLSGTEDQRFRGVSIDTRTLKAGELFFCIQGPNFDGHRFIEDAVRKSAAGIIVSDADAPLPAANKAKTPFMIRTRNTEVALQQLARVYRRRVPVRVVGVTGTNGKSTTKEMIAAIAETTFKTLKTRGNFNNHFGLPLSVLQMDPDQQAAVLEMGMSGPGEIRLLADIARPDIGVITNISEGHLEKLKTVRNVQAAKGELFESLDKDATAIVNADDPLVFELSRSLRARAITFGIDAAADVRATDIEPKPTGGFDFTVRLFEERFPVILPFLGQCNIYNALAALATGHSLGIEPQTMCRGLAGTKLLAQRQEVLKHASRTIINDAYNANPRSMREALATLAGMPVAGRRFMVIGDMLELGELSANAHTELGRDIAKHPIDVLVTVGELASLAAEGAASEGMDKDRVLALETRHDAAEYLKKNTRSGDCLLIKGSRGAAMEEVIRELLEA